MSHPRMGRVLASFDRGTGRWCEVDHRFKAVESQTRASGNTGREFNLDIRMGLDAANPCILGISQRLPNAGGMPIRSDRPFPPSAIASIVAVARLEGSGRARSAKKHLDGLGSPFAAISFKKCDASNSFSLLTCRLTALCVRESSCAAAITLACGATARTPPGPKAAAAARANEEYHAPRLSTS